MIEDFSHFEGEPKKLGALVAGAYLALAEHCPIIDEQSIGFVGCECGWRTNYKVDTGSRTQWEQHIAGLTPADAERSLQVYAQERVLEEAKVWDEVCHEYGEWRKSRLAAATARLAELKGNK